MVYVIGGWQPRGGAYMACEVGQLAAKILDAKVIVCDIANAQPSSNFNYSGVATFCSVEEFLKNHTRDDLLILNPSFQVPLYSLHTRCWIISYVQGYKTFWHLDPHLESSMEQNSARVSLTKLPFTSVFQLNWRAN